MIEGLDHIFEGGDQPGAAELRGFLQELLNGSGASGCLLEQQTLQPRERRVFRLRFDINGQERSLIVKRLKPEIARRNELVANRWLPAIGLEDCGTPVLGVVAEHSGVCVWHVYEDLGQWELDPRAPDRERVRAAIELVARMHTGFAGHALLGEIRMEGGDMGIRFYESNVRDAIYALEAWQPGGQEIGVRHHLLERLHKLRDELPQRAQALAQWDGHETLVHGDLWAINVFVIPESAGSRGREEADLKKPQNLPPPHLGGYRARLIDWDHAAVGPPSYDLSTFLLRFPSEHRLWMLDLYRQAVARAGWSLPGSGDLNLLFQTHEYARFANRIIWPAIALVMDDGAWGVEALTEIEDWFRQFEAVLPLAAEVAA